MDKSFENMYKQLQQAIDAQNPKNDEEVSKIVSSFMNEYNIGKSNHAISAEEQSDEFLEKAYQASSPEKAMKWVEKALTCNPDNFDAKVFDATFAEDNQIDALDALDKLLAEEEQKLKKEGYYKEIGEFWMIFQTRPYMRALSKKVVFLENLDRNRDAIKLCERMLELCNNDNLGVRYQLMALYAQVEDIKSAELLLKRFKNEESVHFLLPLCICYYRCGDYENSKIILAKLYKSNKYAKKILNEYDFEKMDVDSFYSPGSESEVKIAIDTCERLLLYTPSFFDFLKNF